MISNAVIIIIKHVPSCNFLIVAIFCRHEVWLEKSWHTQRSLLGLLRKWQYIMSWSFHFPKSLILCGILYLGKGLYLATVLFLYAWIKWKMFFSTLYIKSKFKIIFVGEENATDSDFNNNIILFSSEVSQRSGILNPWIWLANSMRSSILDFPIQTPHTDCSEFSNMAAISAAFCYT